MAHHEEPHLAVHMLSGIGHGSYVECFADPRRDPIWAHMIENRAQVKDGIIHVPQGPGFDLVLDEKLVNKHRIG
jgi:D-arabinonate dehydratase